jgi:predicted transcriptional regulator of viral defense system
MQKSTESRLRTKLKRAGALRARELEATGIARAQLSRLVAAGKLQRLARGLYALPEYRGTEHTALLSVVKRAPQAVFCLLTALRLHELTTQTPFEVWIAIGNKDHPPRMDYPPLRVVRFSAASMRFGVEVRRLAGGSVKLTSVAKTVADCFKFRNKVGLDVALEALREARRARKVTADDLWRCARINRVANVMRPYMEAVT